MIKLNPLSGDGSIDQVQLLCLENIGLAKHIAKRVCKRYQFIHEDLVFSAAFEALAYSATKFDQQKGKFSTFAGNMIEWQCAIEIKKYRKRQMKSLNFTSRDGEQRSIEPQARPDETEDRVQELREAVAQLKPAYNWLIHQLLNGKTTSQIAKECGVTHQAIWERYKRAVRDLGLIMEKTC